MKKIILAFVIACFVITGCKKDAKKVDTKTETIAANMQTVALNISGMTCEIGCARTIQSKLSKKDGVAEAKVIFKDSIATIKFDANKTSKKELIAFVDGISGGDIYTASETTKKVSATSLQGKRIKK
ncbi:MAG: heavy-metal-associated domain-containing protein [Polaribacter sp.]